MTQLQRRTLLLLMALGLLAAVIIAAQRVAVEQGNKTVALAVSYGEVANLAQLTGKPLPLVLQQLKQAGITHIALTEMSLQEAVQALPFPTPYRLPENVAYQIKNKLPGTDITTDMSGYLLAEAAERMPNLGVGYDYVARDIVHQAGLELIARPRPEFTVTGPAVGLSLDAVHALGAKIAIFNGTEVLGNEGLLDATATALAQRGLTWGFIELVPQMGAEKLARAVQYDLLRVHSISEAEMQQQKVTPESAVDRYSLAVRERKVRVCFVRLFFNHGVEPLTANVAYVADLSHTLRHEGYTPGDPAPYPSVAAHHVLQILLYGAIGAVVLATIQLFFSLSLPTFWGLYMLMVAFAVAQGAVGLHLLANLAGLLAACLFPALGVLLLRQPERPDPQPVRRAVLAFLGMSALTVAGGLLIAGLFNDLPHLLAIEYFFGVKPAAVVPLLLGLTVGLSRAMPAYRETRLELGAQRGEAAALGAGLRQALDYAVRYWHALVILLALAVIALLVLRSGNDAPVGPSGVERQFRTLLDHLLWVRPRTKEFLFGHPLMFLSLALMFRGTRRGIWLGLTAGIVGQISLLNTFCHLHTPLLVSLVRAFHGVWIGLVIGLIVWALVNWWEKRGQKTREASQPPPVGSLRSEV